MRILTAVLGVMLMMNAGYAADEKPLETEKDRLSYSIGMDIGSNLKRQSIDVDAEILSRGIKDTLAGEKQLLTEEEFRATMENFRNSMMAKQQEQMKEVAEKNKKEGETFLAANKEKEGVVATTSGLQYKVLKDGDGDMPKATDTVTVNYKGTLIDGTEFDSSYKRGEPATFPVNGVIPGWTEALQLMKTGSKWQLFIPSNLAYGERGAGQIIGPHSTLVFDVELISIKEAAAK